MKKYLITDAKGRKYDVQSSDMRMALTFYDTLLRERRADEDGGEPVKVKLVTA